MTVHVLIVEDDTELRKAILYGLQKAGYQVSQAASGEEAIELLSRTDATLAYDLVITDIVMGNADGTEVLRAARNRPEAPEVMLLTGYGSLDTAMAAIKAGAFDYLLKPCRMSQLLERANAAIEQRTEQLRKAREAEAWHKMSHVFSQLQDQTDTSELPDVPSVISAEMPSSEPPQTAQPDATAEAHSPSETRRYMEVGALRIDTHRHEVWFHAQAVHVTFTEYTILTCLAATPERVVSFDEIAAQIHDESFDQSRARPLLAWHIGNLRKKIDRRYLVSVRSVGYMLTVPDQASQA